MKTWKTLPYGSCVVMPTFSSDYILITLSWETLKCVIILNRCSRLLLHPCSANCHECVFEAAIYCCVSSPVCSWKARQTLLNGVILCIVCHCTSSTFPLYGDMYTHTYTTHKPNLRHIWRLSFNVILLSSVMARPATHEVSDFVSVWEVCVCFTVLCLPGLSF